VRKKQLNMHLIFHFYYFVAKQLRGIQVWKEIWKHAIIKENTKILKYSFGGRGGILFTDFHFLRRHFELHTHKKRGMRLPTDCRNYVVPRHTHYYRVQEWEPLRMQSDYTLHKSPGRCLVTVNKLIKRVQNGRDKNFINKPHASIEKTNAERNS
jgi:hypothetical protein